MNPLEDPRTAPVADADAAVVVVVGAGHNGLVVAGYLAATGLEVVVLEGLSTLGRGHSHRAADAFGIRP